MRIYIAHEDPYNAGNPYIYTLMEGIQTQHPDIEFSWGTDIFWNDKIFEFDIVHFHWTQAFMSTDEAHHTTSDLSCRLKTLKEHNIKIVATCHDLESHYNQCREFSECLGLVYKHCDAIFHMGHYSLELFSNKYPNTMHLYLPHHLYNTVYTSFPTKEESIKHLGLSPNRQYVLCLGMFRAEEERNLVKKISPFLSQNRLSILAPAFMEVEQRYHHKIIPTKQYILKKYYRAFYHISCSGRTWVPVRDEQIPYYYGAASIAFVHRLKILNSGNAILPMLFGKVVVGPNVGNCGEVLIENGCPTFNVNPLGDITNAVAEGLRLAQDPQFVKNLQKNALLKYSTEKISDELYNHYKSII